MTQITVDNNGQPWPAAAPTRANLLVDRGCALLIALVIAGYPAVAVLGTIFAFGGNIESIAFRAAVVGLSALMLLVGVTTRRYRMDGVLAAFMLLYLGRLVHDHLFANIYQSDFVLTFYAAAVLLPTLALGFAGVGPGLDRLLSRWLMVLGAIAVFGTFWAQRQGLAYNPWADMGGTTPRLMFESLNPISLGYAGATSLVAAFVYLTTYRDSRFWTIFSVVMLAASGPIILAAGSRGPLIATIVSLAWLGSSKMSRLAFIIPAGVGLLAFGLSKTYAVQHLIDTLMGGWELDGSSLGRLDMQRWALEDFARSPIIGAHFASDPAWGGAHPHNIIIETAMAMGMVGLALMFVFLMRTGFTVMRSFKGTHPLLTALLVMQAVNALLSSALWAAEALFVITALVLVERQSREIVVAPVGSHQVGPVRA